MTKTILITGATSGIGFETALDLAAKGHHLLVHGRSAEKIEALKHALAEVGTAAPAEGFVADLSRLGEVRELAARVKERPGDLDVLINNAGVLKTNAPTTKEGHDVRFVVNTLAPYLLMKELLPRFNRNGRIINLSSAAQSPVRLSALVGPERLSDFEAYAQSKLALTMWSCHLGRTWPETRPVMVAVNPGSMLGTNMVKEGFGVAGNDVRIGSEILVRAALSEEFATASGKYFDNDEGCFLLPHPDATDSPKCEALVESVEEMCA